MNRTVKKYLILSMTLVLIVLVGCSKGANTPATSSIPTSGDASKGKPSESKEITVVLANHPWTTAIQTLLPEFQQKTGITVNIQNFFETQLEQKLSVSFTAQSKTPDVFLFSPLQNGKLWMKNGWIQPLNDYVNKDSAWNWGDFSKPAVGTVTFDGKISGAPVVTETEVLYYRKDVLEKAGLQPPKTMEELSTAAKKLHDPNNGFYGFVGRGQRASATSQQSGFLFSYGADWDKDGKATVNTPEAIQAFITYGTLLKDYGPPGVLNMSWPQAAGIIAQGKAAMYIDASSLYTNMTDPDKSTVADKIGFAPLPAGPAGTKPYNVTSWALAMNSKSANKAAAWEFIQWVTSKEVVLKTQEKGNSGARQSVWDSPEGIKSFPKELVEVIKKSAETGVDHTIPRAVKVNEARDIVGTIVQTVIEGKDVKVAADKAQAAYQALLDAEGK